MKRLLAFAVCALVAGQAWGAQHFSHTKFAAMTYSVDPFTTQSTANAQFLGRHFDLLINPTTYINTNALTYNPNLKMITYETISTVRETDTTQMKAFGYDLDSILIHANSTSTVSIQPPQPVGSPCVAGDCQSNGPGTRLRFCQWNTYRNMADWGRTDAWDWAIRKLLASGSSYSNCYGVMEDEAHMNYYQGNLGAPYLGALASPHVGWGMWPIEGDWCVGSWSNCRGWESYVTHDQVRQRMLDIHDVQIKRIVDSMNAHGKKLFSNAAAYGIDSAEIILDARRFGRSILFGEGMYLSPGTNSFKSKSWDFMDSLSTWGPVTGCEATIWVYTNRADSVALPAGNRWQRIVHHNYCWYMMAVNPYTYFTPVGNEPGGTGQPALQTNSFNVNDSLYKFPKIFAVDIGLPTGARSIVVPGTYPVYRRNFQRGAVLYRPGPNGLTGVDLTESGAVAVTLNGNFYRYNYDSSHSAVLTSTTVKIADGAVLVDSTYFSNSVSISNASSVTEGNQLSFPVTRNWTSSSVTIYYNTVDGTAVAPEDYVAELNGQLTIPAGFSTGTIFVNTNTDALLEPTQSVGVHLSSSTDGSIITADATGAILDGTAQPSPTNEKKLKLKKE